MPVYPFNDAERLVGEAAKNQAVNSENTIFDAKRLIGNSLVIQRCKVICACGPFKVEKSQNDGCLINVTYKGENISTKEVLQ